MTQRRIGQWLKSNRWMVAMVLVVFGGYLIGKDMALRDNARDRVHVQAAIG